MNGPYNAPIQNLWFRRDTTDVLFTGIIVGENGLQIGDALDATVSTTIVNVATILGDDIPEGAVGIIFDNDNVLRWTASASAPASMDACPTIPAGASRCLGRVAR